MRHAISVVLAYALWSVAALLWLAHGAPPVTPDGQRRFPRLVALGIAGSALIGLTGWAWWPIEPEMRLGSG